jgi:tRNA-modifying protein YgfZ
MTDYVTARQSAVLFDRSKQGKLEVTGKDAPSFLHGICTNDIKSLPLGGGCEAYFCSLTAKVLAHAIIYHLLIAGKHTFWLDVTEGYNQKLLAHLNRQFISEDVEPFDHTETFAQFHLAGPAAATMLGAALGQEVPPLGEFMHMERTFTNGVTAHIRRHDPLGLTGYDIVCHAQTSSRVMALLQHVGVAIGTPETYETLRIEAATPVYGIDIQEDRFVMEVANPLRGVSYDKGCYLGQEPIVMARDRAGFVNRTFMAVHVLGPTPLPAGTALTRDGKEVGIITSSTWSPRLNAPIAIGYLRRGHQEIGLELMAVNDGVQTAVRVLGYPPQLPN